MHWPGMVISGLLAYLGRMMWVNIYGDDMDFIALWVCFYFPPLGPHLGGFLFGSFCLLEVLQHLTSQWPILPHDWMWSPWQGRRLCQVHGTLYNSHMHVGSGGSVFLLLLLWVRLRLLAPFVDIINSFGSEAYSIEVVCYGYVSPAWFGHLGCCGLEVKGGQFLTSSLSVRAWTRQN